MKYFNEDESYVNAECEKCGKVLKIKRERCFIIRDGYKVEPAAKCFCGNISNSIFKKTDVGYSTNVPRCPTCKSANIQRISGATKVVKVALFGIFATGAVSKTFKCSNCGHQW